jgi:hypothetical protein
MKGKGFLLSNLKLLPDLPTSYEFLIEFDNGIIKTVLDGQTTENHALWNSFDHTS